MISKIPPALQERLSGSKQLMNTTSRILYTNRLESHREIFATSSQLLSMLNKIAKEEQSLIEPCRSLDRKCQSKK